MEESLDGLVKALCADYARRESLLRQGGLSRRVECELRYINAKITDAALEICDIKDIDIFITDIGASVGYCKSDIDYMSEKTYKKKKLEIKSNIAKKLYLVN